MSLFRGLKPFWDSSGLGASEDFADINTVSRPILQSSFFKKHSPKGDFFRRFRQHYKWNAQIIPVYEWEGLLYVATDMSDLLETPPKDWPGNWVLIEASSSDLENVWNELSSTQTGIQAEAETGALDLSDVDLTELPDLGDLADLGTIPDLGELPDLPALEDLTALPDLSDETVPRAAVAPAQSQKNPSKDLSKTPPKIPLKTSVQESLKQSSAKKAAAEPGGAGSLDDLPDFSLDDSDQTKPVIPDLKAAVAKLQAVSSETSVEDLFAPEAPRKNPTPAKAGEMEDLEALMSEADNVPSGEPGKIPTDEAPVASDMLEGLSASVGPVKLSRAESAALAQSEADAVGSTSSADQTATVNLKKVEPASGKKSQGLAALMKSDAPEKKTDVSSLFATPPATGNLQKMEQVVPPIPTEENFEEVPEDTLPPIPRPSILKHQESSAKSAVKPAVQGLSKPKPVPNAKPSMPEKLVSKGGPSIVMPANAGASLVSPVEDENLESSDSKLVFAVGSSPSSSGGLVGSSSSTESSGSSTGSSASNDPFEALGQSAAASELGPDLLDASELPPPPMTDELTPTPSPKVSMDADIPNEERLILDQLPKVYQRSFLAVKAGNSLRIVSWPNNLDQQVSGKDKDFSLNTPSPFRIAVRTEKAYHGYLVQTPFMTQFLAGWNEGHYPETFSVVPVRSDNNVVAFILSLGSKEADKKAILQIVEKAADTIGKKWAKLSPVLLKAA